MQTCSKYHIISYLVDACLIAGIFASGIYLARNTYADEPAATDDGEVIFTGAPPLTSTPISRDCPMTNLNTVEVVVDLSFSRDGYPEPINPSDAEDTGDRLLDLFVQRCYCNSSNECFHWTLVISEFNFSKSDSAYCPGTVPVCLPSPRPLPTGRVSTTIAKVFPVSKSPLKPPSCLQCTVESILMEAAEEYHQMPPYIVVLLGDISER
jgi:hypothetical protein